MMDACLLLSAGVLQYLIILLFDAIAAYCPIRGLFGREDDYIFEDYIYLEENGNVLVDKMCMLQVATGKTSFQTLVAKRRH